MNPNMQTNNINTERPMNPAANPGIRPVGMNPYNNTQQVRPIRMEPPRQVGRNENYQQNYMQQNQQQLQSNVQQYQQQNMMQQNQQRQFNMQQQQQNLRFPTNGGMVRPQPSPVYNQHPNSGIQKSPGAPFEGERMQMTPQVRQPGFQQQMRPSNYTNGGIPMNQINLQNHQRMEAPRAPSDRMQGNFQNVSQVSRDPRDAAGYLSRKPSELDIKPPSMGNNNQKPPEVVGKPTDQNGNASNASLNDRKPDTSAELTSEINESQITESEKDGEIKAANRKTEKKNEKENSNHGIKDETITSGMVQKNIKFFEKNDTMKIPLKPETVPTKKSKTPTEVPRDVVKSDINKNEYESGVDETPVVHPNLGSIFQVPRKVAKIPYLKGKKRSRRHKRISEEPLHKKQIHDRPAFSVFLKSNHSYVPYKLGSKKIQNIKTYGSKEELLAFFENTKSWRKLNRYESKTNQNATRDKLVHKPTTNGDIPTPKKTPSKLQTPSKKNPPLSPTKTPLKSPGTPGTPGTPGAKSLPKTPESPAPPTPLIKKVPMNKIQVGAAPSPNLKTVRSKIGSLANTTHKPGGGNVKIESHKIDLTNVQPRTEAKNEMYKPSGGEKKIQQVKLQWSAKSKIGSLENATYKPGGGDKKIESVKLDFKEKAKPKVGSKDNVKHVPGGGNVKIDNHKLEFKAQSKVGSLDNVKHKPGGGDIKIFDDKTYLRQISGNSSEGRASGTQGNGDLSIVREVEGRSAPGTPGRSTSVKIRKITTIENSGESPKIKNITKVTVTSHTPKKEKQPEKSPTKQQVKVTYSKIASMKMEENEPPLGIVRLPANDNAPILKPSLGKKDLFSDPDLGKRTNESESRFDYDKIVSSKNVRITGNIQQNSASPNLHESKSNRDDTGMSKFLQDEMSTQEKIGEIWRERNTVEVKQNQLNRHQEGQQRDLGQSFLSENYDYGSNHRQFRSQNPGGPADTQMVPNESRRLNYHSSQSIQPDQISINPTFMQSQQQRQINQQSSFYPP